MFSLSNILTWLAYPAIIIATWSIYYFIGRIIATRKRWDEPEPPSADELSEHYAELQEYDQHPR